MSVSTVGRQLSAWFRNLLYDVSDVRLLRKAMRWWRAHHLSYRSVLYIVRHFSTRDCFVLLSGTMWNCHLGVGQQGQVQVVLQVQPASGGQIRFFVLFPHLLYFSPLRRTTLGSALHLTEVLQTLNGRLTMLLNVLLFSNFSYLLQLLWSPWFLGSLLTCHRLPELL